ncbi:MAG: hypothetical protein RJA70_3976 [Pseudomonadota bacterium]
MFDRALTDVEITQVQSYLGLTARRGIGVAHFAFPFPSRGRSLAPGTALLGSDAQKTASTKSSSQSKQQ